MLSVIEVSRLRSSPGRLCTEHVQDQLEDRNCDSRFSRNFVGERHVDIGEQLELTSCL